MPAFQPRSLRRSTADECWFSPVIKYAVPTSRESDASDNDISNTGNDGDDHDTASMVMVAMPPAHDQLLSGDHPSSEALKGHDHAQVDLVDNLDCYIGDGCRQKLSVVKQLGGGSWLLGSVAHLSLSAQKRQPCKIEIGGGEKDRTTPPGLVRVSSDDDSSTGSSFTDENERRVSFAPTVTIQPIPHAFTLSSSQRRRMFATSFEVHKNRARNKKEFHCDGCDWRTATEEWDMYVDMVTGEMVHPVHY